MSELQSYLKTKLNDFSKTDNVLYRLNAYCESDRELKRLWKRDHEEIRNQWQGVSSVAAIQEYMRGYAATIERYKNISRIKFRGFAETISLRRNLAEKALWLLAASFHRAFCFIRFHRVDTDCYCLGNSWVGAFPNFALKHFEK